MLKQDQSMASKEESVDELLAKLAKAGKKVKLLDESASVKELPHQEDEEDEEFGRETPNQVSPTKKKMQKVKNNRHQTEKINDHAKQIIEETNIQLQQEAQKREELQRVLQEMEMRIKVGGNVLEEKER